ncbi:WD repeat domain phosphoinositide-interacting protein 2 [Plecturocebus cupreus]
MHRILQPQPPLHASHPLKKANSTSSGRAYGFHPPYADDLGAVGGTCLEDEASALRLDEDSEQPPMILRTD